MTPMISYRGVNDGEGRRGRNVADPAPHGLPLRLGPHHAVLGRDRRRRGRRGRDRARGVVVGRDPAAAEPRG